MQSDSSQANEPGQPVLPAIESPVIPATLGRQVRQQETPGQGADWAGGADSSLPHQRSSCNVNAVLWLAGKHPFKWRPGGKEGQEAIVPVGQTPRLWVASSLKSASGERPPPPVAQVSALQASPSPACSNPASFPMAQLEAVPALPLQGSSCQCQGQGQGHHHLQLPARASPWDGLAAVPSGRAPSHLQVPPSCFLEVISM